MDNVIRLAKVKTVDKIKNLSNEREVYEEIEQIEQSLEQGDVDAKLVRTYHMYCSQVNAITRCFDVLVKYKIYENPNTQDAFFRLCCKRGQRSIYDRYMPNYLPKYIHKLTTQPTTYTYWYPTIFFWTRMQAQEDKETLGLHFIATISILETQGNNNSILDDMLGHKIYKKMMMIYREFCQKPDMQYIQDLHDIGYRHAINIRKMDNFYDDPWVAFYESLKHSDEYLELMNPYYEFLDEHNVNYKNKLIIFLTFDKNIGDNYIYMNNIIHWSLKNKVGLIAFLTKHQSQWIGLYYKDYIDDLIILDANVNILPILKISFPGANKAIALGEKTFNIPPYYHPATNKIRFNLYTSRQLNNKNAPLGKPVKISNIPQKIKDKNLKLLQEINIEPEKIILLEYKSNATNGGYGTNILLLDFWEQLAIKLKNEGFFPIVNIAHADQEQYLKNAPPLCLPLSHIVDFVDNIGGFIAIRTGLCDLLISSKNTKKYCVYPSQYDDFDGELAGSFHLVHLKSDPIEQYINEIINSLKDNNVEAFEN